MFVASAAVTMSRARNTATAEDILKCLKTEVSCLDPEVYNQLDHDSLCESYEMFLHAMFRCTARPTNAILEKACLQNFPHASPGEIDKLVKAIQTCVKHIRLKVKHASSGKNMSLAMKRLGKSIHFTGQVWSGDENPKAKASPAKGAFAQRTSAKRKLTREVSIGSSILPVEEQDPLCMFPETWKPSSGAAASSGVDASALHVISSAEEEGHVAPQVSAAWVDNTKMVLRRHVDGRVQEATMSSGPNGFAMAAFGDETMESEIPNAALVAFKQKGMKRPAAAPKELKRPAAAKKAAARPPPSATSSAEEQDAAAAASEPSFERTYRMEDYLPKGTRKYGSLGIRQNFGDKKQIKSFSLNGISREDGLALINTCLADLHAGASEKSVQTKIDQEVKRLKAA